MKRLTIKGAAVSSLAAMVLAALPVLAQNTEEPIRIDLAAGRLAEAITELSVKTGVQILAPSSLLEGRQTAGLRGTFTAEQALGRLVEDLGLVIERTGPRSLALAAAPQPSSRARGVEEVLVTGSYTRRETNAATGLNMSLRETPQSVTVITHERIEDQNLNEISEVLNQAVGVTYDGSTLGSDGDKFYGRGFTITNYQINGVPRPAGIYGFQTTTSDMSVYDRVEIVRGATGLMNGVGNPSASINMIRKRPTEEFVGKLAVQAGSWDRQRLGFDLSGPLTDGGAVRGLLATAYQQSDSHIDRIALEKYAVAAMLEADVTDRTLLSVGVEYQDFQNHRAPRGGVPLFLTDGNRTTFARSTNTSAYWGDLANKRSSLFADLEHEIGDRWLLKVSAEHTEPEYDEVMGYATSRGIDPQTGTGGTLYSARWAGKLEQDFVGAFLQGEFSWLGREHEVAVGFTDATSGDRGLNYCGWWCGPAYAASIGNIFDFFADGQSTVTMPNLSADGSRYGGEITQTSTYGAVRLKPTDRLALIFGGRVTDWKEVEYNETAAGVRSYTPENEEDGVFTPYFGFVANITDRLSAYASYTQIFEPQSEEDVNGSKLDPTEGTNYEAGLKSEFFDGRLSASVGFYRVEQDNYPVYVEGAFTPTGGYAYRAEDGTLSKGFEIEVAGELLPGWQMAGGFSRAKPNDNVGAALLAYVPQDNFKLFSSYAFSGRLDPLLVGGNLRWQNKTTTDIPSGGIYTQGGFTLLDLMAKYTLSSKMSVQLNLNNVTDKTYFSQLGWSANYGEPRNLAASFAWTF